MEQSIEKAAKMILEANYIIAFTGAGVSVESGIPPFRGEGGLWNQYDSSCLDLDYFYNQTDKSWKVIYDLFYDFFGKAKPNAAHIALAELEKMGKLKSIITQNIDNLHQEAGNTDVIEFHGTASTLICTKCKKIFNKSDVDFTEMPPVCCKCGSVLKPNFVFFGEGIPSEAYSRSMDEANKADLVIVIGTSGEVQPACMIPRIAKSSGANIIEINKDGNIFAHSNNDIFFQGKAGEIMPKIMKIVKKNI